VTGDEQARRLYEEGVDAFRSGDNQSSKEKNEEALELAQASGDREAAALALVGLSRVALREGDYAAVCSLANQARERVKGLDAAADARPLHLLAAGTRLAGDYDEAQRLYAESLELSRKLGDDRGVWMELHNLGFVELHRANPSEAAWLFGEAEKLCGDEPYDVAMTDLERAALEASGGRREKAEELLAAAEETLSGAGIVLDPDDAFEVEWLREALHKAS
jgi:tetratricopeptide (TPR) repeat protein